MSSIDNLKKEAKRWLKAIREGDAEARARLTRAWPGAPGEPGLRDVQQGLAREHGFDNWIAFTAALDRPPTPDALLAGLESAATRGDADEVARLAELDLEPIFHTRPNAFRGRFPWGALVVTAAVKSSAAALQRLIRHGPSVNVPALAVDAAPGYTALHAAAFHGNLDAVRVLLRYGADVRLRDGARCQTAAAWADRAGHTAARDLILQSGRVDIFDAISLDRPDLIRAILDRDPGALTRPFQRYAQCEGASDPSRPKPSIAPIDWALQTNRTEAARILSACHEEGVRAVFDPVATFLRSACWDHHVHGKRDHRMHDHAAQRLLAHDPDIARHSLYTAVVCGDLDEVRRILDERPEAARLAGGARNWTPLLYLCYARFTHEPTLRNTEAIARLLLDRGADPNDFYMASDSQYTALVGAAGEGEQDSPRQPWGEAVYALLLERGAGPYDLQVLYNTHFSADMLWWLQITYDYSVAHGMKADWDDPSWSMLDMAGYGPGSYFVLDRAMRKNNIPLVEWALAHGADPTITSSSHPKFRARTTLYDAAVLQGRTEIAALLERHGGVSGSLVLTPGEALVAACLRLDAAEADAILAAHPELRDAPHVMFEAAKQDRVDVLGFLLDRGVPLEVADARNTRALHHAAVDNSLAALRFLIGRGAEIDPRETAYGAAPIGWAAHSDHAEAVDLLSRYSRDLRTLTSRGYVDRVRELLQEEPALARQISDEAVTPLWWLPDEEDKALVLADLLMAAGADPKVRTEGRTAADWARLRGLFEVARLLDERADG